ncbi:MAG: COX15/CtaA family protein [Synechococcus sp.]|nr:COX15/CtaA family protein [Synechococcus sp.]
MVALLALVAIGGATRVMEAGLACPDWPLCYGVLLPGRQMNMQVFLEWFHRLDAFLVGLALLVLCGLSLWWRSRLPGWFPLFSGAALLLVAVQGGLGALTVTRLLQADVVTAHLATALGLVALVSAGYQRLEAPPQRPPLWFPLLAALALALVFAQCVLGGLMASQWAVDRCLAAAEGCRWLLAHRLGAYPGAAAVLVLALASLALPRRCRSLQLFSGSALLLVAAQVALGVATLRQQLQWPALTVAHQLDAALLVAVLAATLGRSLAAEGAAGAPRTADSDSSLPPVEVAHG